MRISPDEWRLHVGFNRIKNLAREIGAKSSSLPARGGQPAQRLLAGGTSPFATRRAMPVFIEASILDLPRITINGGLVRGYFAANIRRCACNS